jgi:hypothetical protein
MKQEGTPRKEQSFPVRPRADAVCSPADRLFQPLHAVEKFRMKGECERESEWF